MAVCIAKSKSTLAHYFIRLAEPDRVHGMPEGEVTSLVNALTSAKGHKQVASCVERACMLFDTEGGERQPPRIMTPEQCARALDEEFGPVDAKKLALEMFMASPTEIRANSSKSSPAAALDAYETGFADGLASLGDDAVVIVEPVQDWMCFRNMLAIGAALLANIENLPQGGRVLDAAGFSRPEENSYGFPVFVAPFKFQASTFLFEFARHPVKSSGLTGRDLDYLYGLYQSAGKAEKRRGGFSPVFTRGLGGDQDVFVATHYDAKQDGVSALDLVRLPREEDKNLYLCVKQEGSQLDMAKKVVVALWNATQALVDRDGSVIGMTQDEESLFMPQQGTMSYTYHSLISKAWAELCYHEGRKLIACKRCGCGVLSSGKGPAREYCSDSCRMQDKG